MQIFRKLYPVEAWRLRDHLLRLTPEDRRRRFFAGVSEDSIIGHCRRIEWLRAVVIGSFVDGRLIGAAELRFDRVGFPESAELAVTVELSFQSQGIGTELLRRALIIASNRGVSTLTMICLLDNLRMQAIARKFDGKLIRLGAEAEADVAVPGPTHLSYLEEAVDDGVGLVSDLWLDLWARQVAGRPTGVRRLNA